MDLDQSQHDESMRGDNEAEEEEEEEEDEESDYSDDDDDDDSMDSDDYDDFMDTGYGTLLQSMVAGSMGRAPSAGNQAAPPVDDRTPLQKWNDYLTKIRTRQTKVVKFLNVQLEGELKYLATLAATATHGQVNLDPNMNENVEDNNPENNGNLPDQPEEHNDESTTWLEDLLLAISQARNPPPPENNGGNNDQQQQQQQSSSGYFTHAMLGSNFLELLGPLGQKRFLLAMAHHDTLSFLQLDGSPCMASVVNALKTHSTPALAELDLVGVSFDSWETLQQWAVVLQQKQSSLRQVNLAGVAPPPPPKESATTVVTQGWLDPILEALAVPSADVTSPLDELKLVGVPPDLNNKETTSAITPSALKQLLEHKKKWWRLSLDGLGLHDEHLHVLTTMFRRDDTCKAGDLLSLQHNPQISSAAYQEFFEGCFFWKRRMGLIKVDNKEWEGQFDLVRSMNNLHNRLDYVVSVPYPPKPAHDEERHYPGKRRATCSFASREKWMEWLAKLGTGLAWEDDKHRINYLWFTLLEKPEFIYSHIYK